jgi:hypothetical protein
MSSWQAKIRCAGFFDVILIITTKVGRIYPWAKIHQSQEPLSGWSLAG